MDIRVHSVVIPVMPSLVHILGLNSVLVRLPVAVFILAFCKSMPMPWSGCVLPMSPVKRHTCSLTFGCYRIHIVNIISILPVKPCRQRRHFSPQMRVNRFVFLNLPILKPRGTSRRNGFASFPFTCGLRHPASEQQVTAAWAQALPQRRARHLSSSFLLAFQGYAPRLMPSRGAL